MDRCDQLRQSALAFAVEFAGGQAQAMWSAEGVVGAAETFHKFLLGAPKTSTKKDVEEMEVIIRQDEANPPSRTFHGEPQRAEGGA